MTNFATDPNKTIHPEDERQSLAPERPYDDEDDDDDADFDDEDEPSASSGEHWASLSGFGSPEWWSCT
jgi:hypothetical protein